jgi:hypothetical protein
MAVVRGLRHRQRLTRTRNVTACPCATKSFIVRPQRLWRAIDVRRRPGQLPHERPSASMIRPSAVGTMARKAKRVLGRTLRHDGKRFMTPAYAPRQTCTEDASECWRRSKSGPVRRSESRPLEGGSFYGVLI